MFEAMQEAQQAALEWAQQHHAQAAAERQKAFANSTVYLLFGFTGTLGGPSVREHIADALGRQADTPFPDRPVEELYQFLDPLIFGNLRPEHFAYYARWSHLCHDDDPADLDILQRPRWN